MDASSVEALEAVAEHFLPSCTGSRLESLEKGAIVDVAGKLLEIEEPRTVIGGGRSEEVANGRILGVDMLAIPIGFWSHHAKKAKDLEGKVVCVYGCYVSVSLKDQKKSVNLRGKGSGRIELAPASMRKLCIDLAVVDIAREAIPSFERTGKPIDVGGPGFRTSLEHLPVCSQRERERLQNEGSVSDAWEVTWEIKAVVLQIDKNKLFNSDQELWVRVLVTDHTSQKDLQATNEVLLSLTGATTLAELEAQARDGSIAACRHLPFCLYLDVCGRSLLIPLLASLGILRAPIAL
jgi:hypothetical protein